MIHDSTNANAAHQAANTGVGAYLARLLGRVTGPMPIVAGPAPSTREGVPGPKVIGEDSELLALTRHVRTPNERLLSFYARTGIGPATIRELSKTELESRVQLAERNAEDEGYNTTRAFFERQSIPSRFSITS